MSTISSMTKRASSTPKIKAITGSKSENKSETVDDISATAEVGRENIEDAGHYSVQNQNGNEETDSLVSHCLKKKGKNIGKNHFENVLMIRKSTAFAKYVSATITAIHWKNARVLSVIDEVFIYPQKEKSEKEKPKQNAVSSWQIFRRAECCDCRPLCILCTLKYHTFVLKIGEPPRFPPILPNAKKKRKRRLAFFLCAHRQWYTNEKNCQYVDNLWTSFFHYPFIVCKDESPPPLPTKKYRSGGELRPNIPPPCRLFRASDSPRCIREADYALQVFPDPFPCLFGARSARFCLYTRIII
jgi:hypothetical protein